MAGNIIKVEIVGDERSLRTATKNAQKDLGDTGKSTSKLSLASVAAFAGIGAAAIKFAHASLEAAETAEGAHSHLDQALDATRVAGGKWVSEAEKNGQKFGATQADIDNALAIGVRGLGDAGKAQRALAIAQDISAATGKPLADAMLLATKTAEGNTKALKGLGIDTRGLTKDQIANGAGLDLLAQKYAGSASRASETFAGKSKALHAEMTNLEAEAGQKLQPALLAAGKAALTAADWLDHHKVVAAALAVVIGTITAALVVQKVVTIATTAAQAIASGATGVWTAAQWLLNAALTANPIGLIIVAIAAFVAGIVLAYKKVGWFRDLVNGAFHLIQRVISVAFGWVQQHWPLLLAILTGPIGLAVLFITKHFDSIVSFFAGIPGRIASIASGMWDVAKNAASSAVRDIRTEWDNAVSFFEGLPGRIGGAAKSAVTAVVNGIIGLINSVIGAINSFQIHLHIHIPHILGTPIGGDVGFDWNGLNIPKIPTLHTGGIFTASGTGEGLAWLKDGEGVFTPQQMQALGAGTGGGGNVYVSGAIVTPSGLAALQRRANKRNGR